MPTYEYRCGKGHHFDVFQKMSDEPVATCPECGEQAQRVLSGGAGFVFKGEGFYITDYRSSDYKKKAEAERTGSVDAAPDKGKSGNGGAKSSSSDSKGESRKSGESKSSGSSGSGGSSGSSGSSGGSS